MSAAVSAELTVPVDGEHDHVNGPNDAPVTLVQYGDFECPECGDAYPILEHLQDRLGDRLRIVYRHFPIIDLHPHSIRAAEAAEAADEQGAFWAMHDLLYENQDALTDDDLTGYAADLGLDTRRFTAALDTRKYEERVREDFEGGVRNGAHAAPTFFINGERYEGPHTFKALLDTLTDAASVAGSPTANRARGVPGHDGSLRETIDRSRSGAPAAGQAVRDRFSADEIFQRIIATADEEFSRSTRLLFFSGLAAGLSMSLSFVGAAGLATAIPGPASGTIGNLLYPLGFLIVVMGGYQLYTENTLTPVTLVLTRIASVPALLRVWGVVLVANVLGAALSAYVLAETGVFSSETAAIAQGLGEHLLGFSWTELFWKGVFAGWLIAGMVWLTHAVRSASARILVVFVLVYTVAAAELAHCIVGASEVLYVVFTGAATFPEFLWGFLVPAALGNTVGGVVLVAVLNYSHTRDRRFPDRDCRVLELDWSEWFFGNHMGQPITPTFPASDEEFSETEAAGDGGRAQDRSEK